MPGRRETSRNGNRSASARSGNMVWTMFVSTALRVGNYEKNEKNCTVLRLAD